MITALILAAGESRRMGQPKMLMPWGKSTVLQTVLDVFQAAGVDDILVVTGGARLQVEALVGEDVRTVFNPEYARGEMLSSLQVGLRAMLPSSHAALIGLGDQPQVQEGTVKRLQHAFAESGASLIVPSYQMHRGHPWLVKRKLWQEILKMGAPHSPREFLNRHAADIQYIEMDTPTILQDLDTPEDYLKSRP